MQENLFKAADGCVEYLCKRNYLNAQKNASDTCINDTFGEVRELLDRNFFVEFPNSFDARCWELLVARQIKKSSLKFQSDNVRVENGGGNSGGPDFKLTAETPRPITIWLECVCPQKPENEERAARVERGDFEVKEAMSDERGSSYACSGVHKLSVSRFTNSLRAKGNAYKCYLKKGIVKKEHFKILCVCGFSISKYKTEMFLTNSSLSDELPVDADFEAALQGDVSYFIQQNLPGTHSHAKCLEIQKDGSKIYAGFQEYLEVFDAIVYFEESPADYLCREKSYRLYYGSKEAKDVLSPYLSILFPSKPDFDAETCC